MEAKSSKKLDDLPKSDDKEFWKDAEMHKVVPHNPFADHGHYFRRVSGHQAYCDGCGWGFQLDPGDRIVEGHLYNKDRELVI